MTAFRRRPTPDAADGWIQAIFRRWGSQLAFPPGWRPFPAAADASRWAARRLAVPKRHGIFNFVTCFLRCYNHLRDLLAARSLRRSQLSTEHGMPDPVALTPMVACPGGTFPVGTPQSRLDHLQRTYQIAYRDLFTPEVPQHD